ncbi:putative O-methyltransferase YrrM [Hymenobacter luteus]|uniref:O-methyltransferase YrrM n=2 Tax=Hymenobacter TaxID=89966 RepID=A0ABR6JU75_9BACT|nr:MULTISPECIES: class I SAM-dependent methyltransferase [Hymenobacter]MBB4599834.1 putative O-methyltransferase YrrM [Hymenobacter latericoloratus]MBB6057856.1 putative O-methyltransferase YrrM [Hymenobacter luteus]
MSRFIKTLRGLGSLLRNPWLLNHVLAADESAWQARALRHGARWQVTPAGLPVVSLPQLLPTEGETVRPFAFRDGGSLPTDLALLRALVRRSVGRRYFEIGTWRGESAANVAEVAAEVVTLNLSAAELQALGLPVRYQELHGFFSRPLPNVRHLYGNSTTYEYGPLGLFDVVFIDGDHRYEAVRTDTRRVFDHLVGPETIVVWHDASRQPGQPRWEVLAGILDGLPAAAPGQLVQVGNTLCALYSPTPLPTHQPDPWADPAPWFEVSVKAAR